MRANLPGTAKNNYAAAETSGDKRQLSNAPVEKKRILRRLWTYLYRYKLLLVLAFLLVITSELLALWGPSLSGKAIDAFGIGPGQCDFPVVISYVLQMVVFYLSSAILAYLLSIVMIFLSRRTVTAMRRDVFQRLSELPVSYFDRRQTGDIISVISYDIDTVNATLSTDVVTIMKSSITVIGAFMMMFAISPKLVIVVLLTTPLSVLTTRFITKKVRPLFRRRSAKLGALNGFVEEMTGGQKTIKAYRREGVILDRFDKKNEDAISSFIKAECFGTVTGPSMNFINNLSLSLVSLFGALLYIAGGISLGSISSFVLYSRKFAGPINEFANVIAELQSAFAAAERVFRLIDEEPEPPDAPDAEVLTDPKGEVVFDHVRFGYTPERTILGDFSLRAEPGKLVAIVGPTGAGKTTVINLLMRFYDVDAGSISIDGKNIASLTRESLRSAFTMVLQDTWLFRGTIYENIAYGRPGATREEVIAAAKAAKIHSFISHLPEGYDTVLRDNAINISKGQKQLLTIARAMLSDSRMLILDEATSNVDTRTEQRISEAMQNLMRGRTCFVIAHRLSTIRNADTILVIADGDVVEQGTHEELMAKRGRYHELYISQFETYANENDQ